MTISSTTSRMTYPGAGLTGPYAFNFRIFSTADLLVTRRSSAGVETTLVYTVDFTLTSGVSVGDATGSITLTTALASGEVLSIRRVPSLVQPTSLRNAGAYFGSVHEDEFDRLVMQVQALQDKLDRAFGVTESYDPNGMNLRVKPETGKVLAWQSSTELGNSALDSGATAIPGSGRTVATVTAYLLNNALFNVKDYGATGDGATNDTAAIALAVAAAQTAAALGQADAQGVGSGACVFFPHGRYLTDEIKITQNGLALVGESRGTQLLARAASQTILRISASYCQVERFTFYANGHLGVRGCALVPADETQVTTLVYQNFNTVEDCTARDCASGFELRCGPTTTGDSQCYYNRLDHCHAVNCQRGFYFNNPTGGGHSSANRNQLISCRAGVEAGGPAGYGNVGFDLTAASTETLMGCSCEGIALGATPLANPTALYIPSASAAPASADNNDNRIFAFTCEDCTRDIDCSNRFTQFMGVTVDEAKLFGTNPKGGYFVGQLATSPAGLYHGGSFSDSIAVTNNVSATIEVSAARVNTGTGTTASVLNGADSAAITMPTRRAVLVIITPSNNPAQSRIYLITSDGSGTQNTTSVVDQTANAVTITGLTNTSFKIHNATGSASTFNYALFVLQAGIP